jgi:SNF2 family DNA or RNA helicase
VVLDEAQNVKNAATKAARVARKLTARWRAALTGTPVENRLSELWSLFQFLNPGLLGSADEFRKRFANPIERANDAGATRRLKGLVAPFILRRVKTDRSIIRDLPEKNEMKVFCPLTREQATLYEAVVRDSLRQIEESDGIQRRGLILATLTKMKQVCDHPALFLHDASAILAIGVALLSVVCQTYRRRLRPSPFPALSGRDRARCSRRRWRWTIGRSSSRSTRRWAGCCRRTSRRGSARRCCSSTAGRRPPRATAW